MSLSETIKAEARALGFDAVGISRLESSLELSAISGQQHSLTQLLYDRLFDWLRRGFQGTMAWMERDPARRADPHHVLPGCQSVISVGMNYYTDHRADERSGHGRIARYAWGQDYHRIMGERLEQLERRIKMLAHEAQTRSYVDTGPLMEKAWAQQAGLGWIGKHSNLVSTQFGSWLVLGEILTTLELDQDEPATDLCGSCTLCIKACPTGAITEPYVVDARRCISYLTIELRGDDKAIPQDLARQMGNRIFGCDDCLDVCPFNVDARPTVEPGFQPSGLTLVPSLSDFATMSPAHFATTFRESPIRRTKHEGFVRNVRIAQRNESRQVQSSAST